MASSTGPEPLLVLGVPLADLLTVQGISDAAREFWNIFGPGGKLHPAYFLEHSGHLVVEGILLVVILYLVLQHTFKPKGRSEEQLTEQEVSQLCKEWRPEPLTPLVPEDDQVQHRVISGYDGKHLVADGKRALNVATFDFLGLSGTESQKATAHATVAKYGVGSCGPRGFYGTLDVHLKLEQELRTFLGTQDAIMYSYDIATVTSVMPAYASKKDVLIIDECCGYPIYQGAQLSRSTVHWFKHNDMQDLERILKMVDQQAAKEKKPLNRRFIVVEGLYANTGELAHLREIVRLKDQYKYRLLVEETFSFGVLGEKGRGAVEHCGLDINDVEVVVASLGNALGSVGGFCGGNREMVEHQRLAGSGYVFSASLPPYLATSASDSLSRLDSDHGKAQLSRLRANAAALRAELRKLPALVLVGGGDPANDVSPLIHLELAPQVAPASRSEAQAVVRQLADHLLHEGGVLVGVPLYSALDRKPPAPRLQLAVNALLAKEDVAAVAGALRKAAQEVLGAKR